MTHLKTVAVVGMGAILPDAPDVTTFWDNIKAGRYSITDVPAGRWNPSLYFDPNPKAIDKTYTKIGAWVRQYEFAPLKWGIPIPPRVQEAMDLAQIWAIAATYQALQDYGYPKKSLDPNRVAVILGNAMGGEGHYNSSLRIRAPEFVDALMGIEAFQTLPEAIQRALVQGMQARIHEQIPRVTEDTMPGELANITAGRVANVFNFTGPNFITDAACASSLAALQAAIEGLSSYQFDAVITGGVDHSMGPESFVKFSKIGALSPDGSRPYAEGANGFVMGEGATIFLLKRLEDAEQGGDNIYAVIRAVGSSSDGHGKGITAPNPLGQQRAIERAWKNAGVSPTTAGLIEGHGTSTQVGDTVEVSSLNRFFGNLGLPAGKIILGSVKSNIGHLKSAAGGAGLLKTILALHEKVLPPNAHFERPNPEIDFSHTPFQVISSVREWPKPAGEIRRAGVSSFGFGGTNFHVVVEEYVPGLLSDAPRPFPGASMPASATPQAPTPYLGLLFLGAESTEELKTRLIQVLEACRQGTGPESRFPRPDEVKQPERLVIAYSSTEELLKQGEKAVKAFDKDHPAAWQALSGQGIHRGSGRPGKIAFLFPGQGSQYVNMLRDLRDIEPVVGDTFQEADEIMAPILGQPLTRYIYLEGDEAGLKQAEENLRNTTITQPAMLTANVALLRVLQKYGFEPDLVIGHSLGEYAALVAAGVLSFAEALEVVSARGREMAQVSMEDNGCMAAVSAPIQEVERILKDVDGYVVIANVNSPVQSVIGGMTAAVEAAITACQQANYQAVKIPVSHAFHTRIVAPASQPLRRVIERMHVQPPRLPVVANVTGQLYPTTRDEIIDLLARQVASPVQFVQGIETLYQNGVRAFVEVGPKRVLNALAGDILKDRSDVSIIATNHPRKGGVPSIHEAMCGLLAAGFAPVASNHAASLPISLQEATHETQISLDRAEIQSFVLGLVSEKTGYPVEMLELSLDLEADLGIDTVKQAELFAAVREQYGIPRRENLRLVDYNTLEKVIQFVLDAAPAGGKAAPHRPDRAAASAPFKDAAVPTDIPQGIAAAPAVTNLAALPGDESEVREYVLSLVSEKTGYPVEMLDLNLDLEADLGIDTVKQAELFAAVRERYSIPRREDLRLNDYNTLQKVIQFVLDSRPATTQPVSKPAQLSAQPAAVACAFAPQVAPVPDNHLSSASVPLHRSISGSVVVSGAGLGLPGRGGHVFQDDNIERILKGESLIEPLPEPTRERMLEKRITRLEKSEAGAQMIELTQLDQTIKLAGQHGRFNPLEEFGLPDNLVESTDISTQLAIAAGIDALRDAGIPLVMGYKKTSTGGLLPNHWMLPPALADETGVIFCSAFPGLERMAEETDRFYSFQKWNALADELRSLQSLAGDHPDIKRALGERIAVLETQIQELNYHFDRRFIFRVLAMGHSQFAEFIGARGPNTSVNAACATTTQAISIAEDWIRLGRCRRVIVIAGDDVTDGHLVNWIGTGLLATGATTTAGDVRQAALPFDRRRNGMIMGMGAAALVLESEDAVRERGMRAIVEVLSTQIANSAYHGTRLDVNHVSQVMQRVVAQAEERYGLHAADLIGKLMFMSHETYTPARGGSAAAEIHALRHTFGDKANQVIIANTKGFTGHAMAVGIEDVVAIKALQHGVVPPIAHLDGEFEPDPDLGDLNLSRGGAYPVQYALRLGAGFGSQIAMALFRLIPGQGERIDRAVYQRWLDGISGYDAAELEVHQHTLRIRQTNLPQRPPATSTWQFGQGPSAWAAAPEEVGPVNEPAEGITTREPVYKEPQKVEPSRATIKDPGDEVVKRFVLDLVSEKTGYPVEMLDLNLDLEADLGIDTVKQAELFAAVREQYGIARREDLRLVDYNTLQKVIDFVHDSRRPAEKETAPQGNQPDQEKAALPVENAGRTNPVRRAPVPILRPRLDLCKATGIDLSENCRVLIIADRGRVAQSLSRRLSNLGVEVILRKSVDGIDTELFKGQPVTGVYFLKGLDVEEPLDELTPARWQELLEDRLFNLVRLMQALPNQPFLMCATRCGGLNGYENPGATAPLGGLVNGFAKALAWERPQSFVKTIDFEVSATPSEISAHLLDETRYDPAIVEVGWLGSQRFGVTLIEKELPLDTAPDLPKQPVFLISGGTAGIIAPILKDLATQTRGTFCLLGRSPLPDKDNPDLIRLQNDRMGLKKDIMRCLSEKGDKASPAQAEEKLAAMERAASTLRAMDEARAAGAQVDYITCDITDPVSVEKAIQQTLDKVGRVDVLIHAAGVEYSRRLESKTLAEVEKTLAVKASSFFYLYQALASRQALPSHILAFSSVAGRFGNAGQTDYSAANELLDRLVSGMRHQHPTIKGQVIDWGAWADIGMASRGHIPELMKRLGIEMLPPAPAAATVYRELAFGPAGTVVIAGALGALEAQKNRQEFLDADKANAALRAGKPIHVMLSRVTGYHPVEGVVLETDLDPSSEPFLKDHTRDGVPLLPGVMGIEGFSVAARHISSVLGAEKGGFRVDRLEEIRFLAPFKFYHNQPRRITWKARPLLEDGNLIVPVTLESILVRRGLSEQPMLHFSGQVYLKPVGVPVEAPIVKPPYWNGAYTVKADDIYRLYFHGPSFQILEGVQRNGDYVLGRMRPQVLPITSQPGVLTASPLLVELVLQTAGIWEAGSTGIMALPSYIGSMTLHRSEPAQSPIFAEVLPCSTPDGRLSFDARVVDGEGRMYLELKDYRTAPLPERVEQDLLAPLRPLLD